MLSRFQGVNVQIDLLLGVDALPRGGATRWAAPGSALGQPGLEPSWLRGLRPAVPHRITALVSILGSNTACSARPSVIAPGKGAGWGEGSTSYLQGDAMLLAPRPGTGLRSLAGLCGPRALFNTTFCCGATFDSPPCPHSCHLPPPGGTLSHCGRKPSLFSLLCQPQATHPDDSRESIPQTTSP